MSTCSRTRSPALSVALAVLALVATSFLVGPSARAGDPSAPPRESPPAQNLDAMALATAQTNTLFVGITPCRIVDTRKAGGRLGKNAVRTFVVAGTTGFSAQGGAAGGCGIPASATAVAASLTSVKPKKNGYLRAWPATAAEPGTTSVSYVKKQSTTAGSTLAVTPGAAGALKVRNTGGPTDLTVDVTGYYLPQMHGMVAPGGPIYAGSSRIVSATNPSAGVYQVTFDGPITYCTPMVDTYNAGSGVYGAAYAFSGSTATVYTWYISSTTHVEVPYSFYFYISVVC